MTATAANEVIAFVMKEGSKFVCVIDDTRIGSSKYEDYFEYHFRRGEIKALANAGATKIAYLDDAGNVTKIVDLIVNVKPKVSLNIAEAAKKAMSMSASKVAAAAEAVSV